MSRTLGSLIIKLGMDPKEADIAIRKFEKNLRDTGRRMESIGKSMSLAITAPLVGMAGYAIKTASDAEEAASKFNVVFKKVGAEAEKSYKILREQYGLSSKASKELLGNTGDLLTGFGFSQESALNLSTEVNKLAVDLASFTNFSGGAAGASAALTKALLGERESIKSLGLAILEADVKERVAKLTKEGMTFATERQAKAFATLQLAQEQSKNALGDYARTQDGFSNQMRLLQARTEDLAIQFGQVMLPFASKLVAKLQEMVKWFSDLSPATQEWIVKIAGLTAMAGPVLVLTGNVIKLATAFKTLAVSFKAASLAGGGLPALIAALAVAANQFDQNFNPMYGGGRGAAETLANYAAKRSGYMPKSSQFGGTEMLLGSASIQAGGIVGTAPKGGWPAYKENTITNGGGGGTGGGGRYDVNERMHDALIGVTSALRLLPRDLAAGMGSIRPNLSPALVGNVGSGGTGSSKGLTRLAGIGPHAEGIAEMAKIMPDMTPILEAHYTSVNRLQEGYLQLGNSIASVMSGVADALIEGGNAWAAFGKAALMAGAQVVKAMLAATLAKTVAAESAKGVVGTIIGITAGMAAIGIVEGLISKMKTPKLAQGGVTTGITSAIIGDNPSGREMVMPWEKTGDFADKIAQNLGGMGGELSISVRGDDLLVMLSRAQNRASRRGSANVISF